MSRVQIKKELNMYDITRIQEKMKETNEKIFEINKIKKTFT